MTEGWRGRLRTGELRNDTQTGRRTDDMYQWLAQMFESLEFQGAA